MTHKPIPGMGASWRRSSPTISSNATARVMRLSEKIARALDGCGGLYAGDPHSADTREVGVKDPDDPYSPENLSWNWRFGGPKWRPFTGRWMRGPLVPPPPGPPHRPSKAEREEEKRAEARAERLHLAGLTNAGVIIMSVVLGAVVLMFVLVLVSHR